MGMTADNQYDLSYVSRIYLGTVGTGQFTPPLPQKALVSTQKGLALFPIRDVKRAIEMVSDEEA